MIMNRVFVLFTILILSSCTPRVINEELDLAHDVMIERPDSALHIIEQIDKRRIKSLSTMAKYALLYSQALDKNIIDVESDSLAKIAVDYYSENGSAEERATAYYYLGRVCENAGLTKEAIINYHLASEGVPDDCAYLKGLIYSELGSQYYREMNITESIVYYLTAFDAFKQADAKRNIAIISGELSHNYVLTKEFDEAIKYAKIPLDIYTQLGDTANIIDSYRMIEHVELNKGVSSQVIIDNMYEVYDQYSGGDVIEDHYYFIGKTYSSIPNADSARHYLYKHLNLHEQTIDNNAAVNLVLSDLETRLGNLSKAMEYNRVADHIIDSLNNIRYNNTLSSIVSNHKVELYDIELKRLNVEHRNYIIIFLLSVVALVFGIYVIVITYRSRLQRKEQDLAIANELIESLTASQSILEKQKKELEQIGEEHSNIIAVRNIINVTNKINSLVEKVPLYRTAPRRFVDEFISLIKSDKTTKSTNIFYELINSQYCGAVDIVKNNYKLDQNETDILCLIYIGFSNSAMHIIFNHTNVRTIYNYRSSLKRKLDMQIDRSNINKLLNSVKK